MNLQQINREKLFRTIDSGYFPWGEKYITSRIVLFKEDHGKFAPAYRYSFSIMGAMAEIYIHETSNYGKNPIKWDVDEEGNYSISWNKNSVLDGEESLPGEILEFFGLTEKFVEFLMDQEEKSVSMDSIANDIRFFNQELKQWI